MIQKPKSMIEKTVGVYMDRYSASHVTVVVGFIADNGRETLTVEYDGKKVNVPYSVVERLAEQARGL